MLGNLQKVNTDLLILGGGGIIYVRREKYWGKNKATESAATTVWEPLLLLKYQVTFTY